VPESLPHTFYELAPGSWPVVPPLPPRWAGGDATVLAAFCPLECGKNAPRRHANIFEPKTLFASIGCFLFFVFCGSQEKKKRA
jgi:hypothetical protein